MTRELYLLPDTQQRLFEGIDKHVTASEAIRRKLVELHDKLLGVQVTPHSPDVEAAYQLFEDARERRREAQDDWFNIWDCELWWEDQFFLKGVVEDDDYDWDRVNAAFRDSIDRIDWSDPKYSAQAWVAVLAYLLMDYRYLYL